MDDTESFMAHTEPEPSQPHHRHPSNHDSSVDTAPNAQNTTKLGDQGSDGQTPGTRTDRPTTSARPAAATATLATGIGIVALTVGSGLGRPGIGAVVSGVFLAGLFGMAGRGTPWARAAGCGCAVFTVGSFGVALFLGIRLGSSAPEFAVITALLGTMTLGTAGAISTFTGSIGDRSVGSAALLAIVGATMFLLCTPVLLVVAPDLSLIGFITGGGPWELLPVNAAIENTLNPVDLLAGTFSFAGVFLIVCSSLVVVLPQLPVEQLLSPSYARIAADRIETVVHAGRWGIMTAVLLIVSLPFARTGIPSSQLPSQIVVVEPVVRGVVFSTVLRVTLLAVTGVLWSIWLFIWLVPWLARRRHGVTVRWLPSMLVCGSISGSVALGYQIAYADQIAPIVETLFENRQIIQAPGLGPISQSGAIFFSSPPVGPSLAVIAVAGILLLLAALLLMIATTGAVGILPRRSAAGTIAASSLISGAILTALLAASPVAVLIPVFCAIFVWDSAAYGVSITAELGPRVAEKTPVLVHNLGSAVVGVFGMVVAFGGYQTAVGTLTPTYAVAATVPLVGVLLVSFTLLRRRVASARLPSGETAHTQSDSVSTRDTDETPHPQTPTAGATPNPSSVSKSPATSRGDETIDDQAANSVDSTAAETATEASHENRTETEDTEAERRESELSPETEAATGSETPANEAVNTVGNGNPGELTTNSAPGETESSSLQTILATAFVFVGLFGFFGYSMLTDLSTTAIVQGSIVFLLFAALLIAWLSQ